MANYVVSDTNLADIADSIRAKGGTSAPLVFPAGFVSAIAAIPAGGGGLAYETGTFTPASNIARPTIDFAAAHAEPPNVIVMADATGTAPGTSGGKSFVFGYVDTYKLFGAPYKNPSDETNRYGAAFYIYSNASTLSTGISQFTYPSTDPGDSSASYPRYWADESAFRPYTNGNTRYWRSGRTYKWIAIWK